MQKSKTANFKKFDAKTYKVGIVVAEFNKDINEELLRGALKKLAEYKVSKNNILIARVAGSVEIPIMLQTLAMREFDCLVAIGTIIRGDTPHFDYVAKIVSEGVLRVMLDYNISIGFGVLTLNSHAESASRLGSGGSAAEAALQNAKLINEI